MGSLISREERVEREPQLFSIVADSYRSRSSSSHTPTTVIPGVSSVAQSFRNPWRPWYNDHIGNNPPPRRSPEPGSSRHVLIDLSSEEDVGDVVEGRVSFNIKEHLYLLRHIFVGRCPECIYYFVVKYQECTEYTYPEIINHVHLPKVVRFFDSTPNIGFGHKSHGIVRNYAKNADEFFGSLNKM